VEVIIINDGGIAEPLPELGNLGDKLAIRYCSQDHKGPAAARNRGIDMAQGDIVLFLDDDSMPLRNWLQATMEAWDARPEYDGIGGYIESEANVSIISRVNADFFNWYLDQQMIHGQCSFLSTCNAGYTKESLKTVGKFDTDFQTAGGEDRDLNLKILKHGGKLTLDRNIRVHHDRDLTLRSFAKKNYNYGKAAFEIYRRYPDQPRVIPKEYALLFLSVLRKYHSAGEKAAALMLLALSQAATALGFGAARILYLRRIER
jgi:glycosyltransferase involved in cell wall biosynthesis